MAKRTVIDFSNVTEPPVYKNGNKLSLNKKQIRARARRKQKITEAELDKLYKPMEEWDEEELARGRPRASDGTFRGATPRWITRQLHEEAMGRFRGMVEGKVREHTVVALGTIHWILSNEDVDDKGRPAIAAGTKLDAAKFLIEHVIGKPTQRQEVDISVKLQALLASATVGPMSDGVETLALPPGLDYSVYTEDDVDDADVVE